MQSDLTCFLIDDDEDDREIFTMAVEDAGKNFKCITAINGKDALQKLDSNLPFIPNFIFLDLNMPIMDGKQFLRKIKKNPAFCTIPVIIYTTSSFEKDMEETKRLGAAHFLTKPSIVSELTRILSVLFQKQALPFNLKNDI